ncbi:hypothetical protein [Paenibacillus endoradicis]|uniref:hypothetical protein n=1 Tax=Paenibacillus endoradicis TaxID=2972487 RepID=UPI002158AFAE|nr:hypothetical protein [Paenibacillus endoradicis]MCR8656919.1 hypothetical protein [Paenibacillus endoradicis]
MALEKSETLDTGIVANELYSVIMLAQINRVLNRIEAEIHVYYDMAARLAGNQPLQRFLYLIEDDAKPQQNTTLWLRLIGDGDINITKEDTVIATVTVSEDMIKQDVVDALLLQTEQFDLVAIDDLIVVTAKDELSGSAGVGVDIKGEAIEVINWIVGSDAVQSILDTQFSAEALSEQGNNLQKQIYEHMKLYDPRYIDAIDV